MDGTIGFSNTLNCDLSDGQSHPSFEQLWPGNHMPCITTGFLAFKLGSDFLFSSSSFKHVISGKNPHGIVSALIEPSNKYLRRQELGNISVFYFGAVLKD